MKKSIITYLIIASLSLIPAQTIHAGTYTVIPAAVSHSAAAGYETASSFKHRLLSLVNSERAKAGLAPLALCPYLSAAANTRAGELEISFSHTRPDGREYYTAITDTGAGFSGSGENAALGYLTPEQVMEGWMSSPGHRSNILNPGYTSIGLGYYKSPSTGWNYWAQVFSW